MLYSIIVPCYNEEGNVLEFYKVLKEELESILADIEIIFVNDGSSDKTSDKLKEIVNKNEMNVLVIEFSRNFGKEAAIKAGLDACAGDYISIIDADLQQRPKYVLEMIDYLNDHEDYDSVACYQAIRKEGFILTKFKDMFYSFINKISDVELYRSASDFRTFRRNVRDAIVSMPENCRFSKGIFSWVGFNTYYMPYDVEERFEGTSKWNFFKLFQYAVDGITAFSTKPLVYSAVIGLIICIFSFITMIYIVIKNLIVHDPVAGFPTLACLILFSTGVQLLFIGVLGQYLSKTYLESKNRPMYVIKKRITGNILRGGFI